MAALCLVAASAGADPCPTRLPGRVMGWPLNSVITYEYDSSVPDAMRSMAAHAFADWNETNQNNRTGVRFQPGSPALLRIGSERLAGSIHDEFWTGGITYPHHGLDGRLLRAEINFDFSKFLLNEPGYQDALRKAMAHELGHTMGLGHPADPEERGSIMNGMHGVNDQENHMPLGPSECDEQLAAMYNNLYIVPAPGSGGGGRQKPKDMPLPPMCIPCPIRVPTEPGAPPVVVLGWCCGANSPNGPRSPNEPPMMAFIATAYQCSQDGWVQFRCQADMCCIHPDDVPEGAIGSPTGTSCSSQGWWEHDQATACRNVWSQDCIKKEICGTGTCMPWPHYCWKEPRTAPTPGGPPPDPSVGVTCSSKGWFDGDKYDACVAEHGACVKKQDCDGQQCLPYPHYCWKPE
jgi:hypothetical protein